VSNPANWQAMKVKCPHGGQMFRVERVAWEGSAPTFRGTCGCCNRDQQVTMQPVQESS
jgi:hypothetical protein